LKNHSDFAAQSDDIGSGRVNIFAVNHHRSPSTRAIGIVSFIRFKVRRNVDFPQPDGPIKAIDFALGNFKRNVVQRLRFAVKKFKFETLILLCIISK
jgi:hypothetical protein